MSKGFLVVCGTYERNLYGLKANLLDSEEGKTATLEPIFIYPSHIGCIKCLGIGGRFLASGSTDEVIKLYDVKKKVELGSLLQHSGSITSLEFQDSSHMLSASEDGTICIWRTSDWESLKVLKGHKGPVHSVAIHPSGKLSLSVGKDKTLHLWNLLKGRVGFVTKLSHVGEVVRWNHDGSQYAILFDTFLQVFDAASTKEICKITSRKRLIAFDFYKSDFIVVGGEDNLISIFSIQGGKLLAQFKGHSNRIRGIQLLLDQACTNNESSTTDVLISISSDGFIKVWDFGEAISRLEEDKKAGKEEVLVITKLLGQYDSTARLTCLSVRSQAQIDAVPLMAPAEKRERSATPEEEEEEPQPKKKKQKVQPTEGKQKGQAKENQPKEQAADGQKGNKAKMGKKGKK